MTVLKIDVPARQDPLGTEPYREWIFPDGTRWAQFHRTDSGYLLRFPDLADYTISADGLEVSCRPLPHVAAKTIRHLYLNQVLPLAFSRRGKLVFHASAIETGSGAIAFVGESGRGKSTLAASFSAHGHRFLADDGLVVEEREGRFDAQPSHPSLRLWEDSQAALMQLREAPLLPLPDIPKASFLAGRALPFCGEARELRRVYFLGTDTAEGVTFTELTAGDALIELVRHSFLLDTGASELIAAHFDGLARMLHRPMCFRLDYPRRFDALAEVRADVLRHCGQ